MSHKKLSSDTNQPRQVRCKAVKNGCLYRAPPREPSPRTAAQSSPVGQLKGWGTSTAAMGEPSHLRAG